MKNIDTIEKVYSNFAWLERVTRRMKQEDRELCMEFYKKQMDYLVTLEDDLLESQIKLSRCIDGIITAKRVLKINKGLFDECIEEFLKYE